MFFEYPELLYLELLLVPMVALYLYRELKRKSPSLTVSSLSPYKYSGRQWSRVLRHIPFVARCIAVAAIIIAIARPRSSSTFEKIDSEGIDIVLAMDISTSMLARDFNPDRIGAAKDIAIQFIAERPSDRIHLSLPTLRTYLHPKVQFHRPEFPGTAWRRSYHLHGWRRIRKPRRRRIQRRKLRRWKLRRRWSRKPFLNYKLRIKI